VRSRVFLIKVDKGHDMDHFTTINPATKEALATYDLMTKKAAFATIDRAQKAFQDWKKKSHEERGTYLTKIADALRRDVGIHGTARPCRACR